MRRAFTLLEILVATMLLSMLVTILTMIFNQSSIAWTTGTAAVAGLNDARKEISDYGYEADNVITPDSGSTVMRVASVWADTGDGLNKSDGRTLSTDFKRLSLSPGDVRDPMVDSRSSFTIAGANALGRDTYIVGVTSWGPDRDQNTWDDISTLPDEVVK